jgi:hypothetical protein
MRWNNRKIGEKRIITKFAFFPITCKVKHKDKLETRWLEFVRIEQMWLCSTWEDWFFID